MPTRKYKKMNVTTRTRVKQNIITALTRFVNDRERALCEARNKYHIPLTMAQARAISKIRRQVAFKSNWGMKGQCRMVAALETEIYTLMPSPHANPRQQGVRQAITDVLTYAKREIA